MASALLIQQSFGPRFFSFTNPSSNCCRLPIASALVNPTGISHAPTVPSAKCIQSMKLLLPIVRASPEGIPAELVEESKFVPLNAEDPKFGPPALLLLGFDIEETTKIQQFLKELDGEFMQIILCAEDMITGSLWDAMNTQQQNWEHLKIAKSLPRVCILSGLTGEEMVMFIDAFPETGLEPAVFAALVPNSADKPLKEVIEEIMGDHETMSVRASGST